MGKLDEWVGLLLVALCVTAAVMAFIGVLYLVAWLVGDRPLVVAAAAVFITVVFCGVLNGDVG